MLDVALLFGTVRDSMQAGVAARLRLMKRHGRPGVVASPRAMIGATQPLLDSREAFRS
ncbi:MAG: hypothetical protein AVDCRST_MAG42-2196 [uncultured Chthoniobacterales bacterium]|uniref:Uncharacterized protein n=1 Tax=uncultured Chthoniobacterales bacterium TaxID=1836801 RepID=A0A6J4IGQ4_9BACT|nr:MAG: hypothetical protein AVDCRST_MAG42-2196 [uncultured Chthoniobacterales bacterium]